MDASATGAVSILGISAEAARFVDELMDHGLIDEDSQDYAKADATPDGQERLYAIINFALEYWGYSVVWPNDDELAITGFYGETSTETDAVLTTLAMFGSGHLDWQDHDDSDGGFRTTLKEGTVTYSYPVTAYVRMDNREMRELVSSIDELTMGRRPQVLDDAERRAQRTVVTRWLRERYEDTGEHLITITRENIPLYAEFSQEDVEEGVVNQDVFIEDEEQFAPEHEEYGAKWYRIDAPWTRSQDGNFERRGVGATADEFETVRRTWEWRVGLPTAVKDAIAATAPRIYHHEPFGTMGDTHPVVVSPLDGSTLHL